MGRSVCLCVCVVFHYQAGGLDSWTCRWCCDIVESQGPVAHPPSSPPSSGRSLSPPLPGTYLQSHTHTHIGSAEHSEIIPHTGCSAINIQCLLYEFAPTVTILSLLWNEVSSVCATPLCWALSVLSWWVISNTPASNHIYLFNKDGEKLWGALPGFWLPWKLNWNDSFESWVNKTLVQTLYSIQLQSHTMLLMRKWKTQRF